MLECLGFGTIDSWEMEGEAWQKGLRNSAGKSMSKREAMAESGRQQLPQAVAAALSDLNVTLKKRLTCWARKSYEGKKIRDLMEEEI